MRTFPLLAGTLAIAIGTPTAANGNDNEGDAPRPLTIALPSEAVTTHLFGRLQTDFGAATGDAPFETNEAAEIRRARLGASGTIYDAIDFKAEFEFSEEENPITDLYMQINGTVAGDVTVGHFKEPFGLEEATSNKYLLFAERSVAHALVPSRNTGIMVSDSCSDGQVNWAVGVFRDTGDDGDDLESDGSELAFTARVTGTLWNEKGGSEALHLGLGISQREADDSSESFSTRPPAHFLNKVIDVKYGTSMPVDSTFLTGFEAAWVDGPLTIQGEYIMASVSGDGATADADYNGMYISGAYFLTGEARPYKAKSGSFGRVKPNSNYAPGQGGGAWMVGARYGMIDVSEGPNKGVEDLSAITLGLTRILNPYTRIVGNVIQASASQAGGPDADATIGVIRFQFDF